MKTQPLNTYYFNILCDWLECVFKALLLYTSAKSSQGKAHVQLLKLQAEPASFSWNFMEHHFTGKTIFGYYSALGSCQTFSQKLNEVRLSFLEKQQTIFCSSWNLFLREN